MESKWKCRKCGKELVMKKTVFDYLERSFSEDLLRCPNCGQVLISQELADGRMADVEAMLEDK
mgnify:CR=1 FL=1|jgi:predicted RNA-binding Zn-ribbon protein involved in translation (DUF1610 family)